MYFRIVLLLFVATVSAQYGYGGYRYGQPYGGYGYGGFGRGGYGYGGMGYSSSYTSTTPYNGESFSMTETWNAIKEGNQDSIESVTYVNGQRFVVTDNATALKGLDEKIKVITAPTDTTSLLVSLSSQRVVITENDFVVVGVHGPSAVIVSARPVSFSPTHDILLCQTLDSTGIPTGFFFTAFTGTGLHFSKGFGKMWSVSSVWSDDGRAVFIRYGSSFVSGNEDTEVITVENFPLTESKQP